MMQGEIWLAPFPFSDQSNRKVRPIIIISNNEYNNSSNDIIAIGVTSNLIHDDYTLNLSQKDLEDGNLITECIIKVDNILYISKELLIKRIGILKKSKLKQSIDFFKNIVAY